MLSHRHTCLSTESTTVRSLHYGRLPQSLPRPNRRCCTQTVCRAPQTAPQNGKTILITGGNAGLGFAMAKATAAMGYNTVLGCRDLDKGQAAKQQILEEVPGSKIEARHLDLGDLGSIRQFAELSVRFGAPLDVLCNNAGVMACPYATTKDGFETQLGVNHLGHFLLTMLLLPIMNNAGRPARIVNLSSGSHMRGNINFDDLMSKDEYSAFGAYSQSKLANLYFTYELARRLPTTSSITVNAISPGVVRTDIQRHFLPADGPLWQRPLRALYMNVIKSPADGARTQLYVATSPEVQGVTGKYFRDCKPVPSSDRSYDRDAARKLWDVSCELVGVDANAVISQLKS